MDQPEQYKLKSGRQVAVHRLANGSGQRTIVFCHPAPGAGNLDPNPIETIKRQVTLIAVDRPGYGSSEPVTGGQWSSVPNVADDLAEVIQALHAGPVGVVGWSAGGRVALALAARWPDLVDRAVIIATPAPDEAVSWIAAEQKQALEAMRGLPADEVHQSLAELITQMLPRYTSKAAALSLLGRSPADDRALAFPGAADRIAAMLQAAFAQGVTGLAADIAGYSLQPWGFEPGDVRARTLCLYGTEDPGAGARHGAWWQKHLHQARLEMVPGAGHLLVIPMWQRVLAHLAPGQRE